jgi:hypothetical protein
MQEYKSLLESKLVNPTSAKSFIEEKREIKISQTGENLEIRYESTGINPENKRKVEQQITQLLAPTISEDKIFVSSFTHTNTITPEVKTSQPAANLKVGQKRNEWKILKKLLRSLLARVELGSLL